MTGDRERQRRLLEDPVGATLIRLSAPMMVGIAALLFFNIVDAFWVGQLGPTELAAMGFTFPVAMVVTNLTIGLSIFGVADPLARIFNDDADVVAMTELYLRVVPLSYAPYGLAILVASLFNAMGMPVKATVLAALRLVVLAIPLAWLGSYFYELTGLFLGIVAANVIMGVVAGLYARREIWRLAEGLTGDGGPRDG